MQQARNDSGAKARQAPGKAPGAAVPKVEAGSKREALRGKSFAEQEQALAPGGGASAKVSGQEKPGAQGKAGPVWGGAADKKGGKVPATQPGPHGAKVGGAGHWIVSVVGKSAAFSQKLAIGDAKGGNTLAEVSGGETFDVEAEGPFRLAVQHSPGPDMKWAEPRVPGQWYDSTHQTNALGADEVEVRTEDFNDQDFDDLVIRATRAPAEDGAYLVSSETRVDGQVTSYDLILGASASGRVDVVLNHAMLSHGELGGLDAMTLEALGARLAGFAGEVASSKEHADKRAMLMAQVAGWQAAVAKALALAKSKASKADAGASKASAGTPSRARGDARGS